VAVLQTSVSGTAHQLPRSTFNGQTLLSYSSSIPHPYGVNEPDYVQVQVQPKSSNTNVAQWVQQQNAYQHRHNEASSFSSVECGFELKTNGIQCSRMPYSNPHQNWSSLACSSTGSNSGISDLSGNGVRVQNENLTVEQRQMREAKFAQLNQLRMLLFHQVPDDSRAANEIEKRTACPSQYNGQPVNTGHTVERRHRPQNYGHQMPISLPTPLYKLAQPVRERCIAPKEYYTTNKICHQQMPAATCCPLYCSQKIDQFNCRDHDVAECKSQYSVAAQSAPVHSAQMPPPWNKLDDQNHPRHPESNQTPYSFPADVCEQTLGCGLTPRQQCKTNSGSVNPPLSQVTSLAERAGVFDRVLTNSDMRRPSADLHFTDHVSPGKRKHSDSGIVEYETSSKLWNNAGSWNVSCATAVTGSISVTSEQNKQQNKHTLKSGDIFRFGSNQVSLSTCGMNIHSEATTKLGVGGSCTMKMTISSTVNDAFKLNTCVTSPSVPCSGVSTVFTTSSMPRSVSRSNMTSASLVSLMQNVENLPVSLRGNSVQGNLLCDKPQLGVIVDGVSSSDSYVFNSPQCLPSDLHFNTVQSSTRGNCVGADAPLPQQMMSVAHGAQYTTPVRNCMARMMTVDQPSNKTDSTVAVHSAVCTKSSVASVIIQSKAPNTISYHPNVLSMTSLSTKTDRTEQKHGSGNCAGMVAETPKYSLSACINGANRGISTANGAKLVNQSQQRTLDTLIQEPLSDFACDSKRVNWLQSNCGSSQRHLAGCSTRVAPNLELHSAARSERVVSSVDSITRQPNGTLIQASVDSHHSTVGPVKGVHSGPLMRLAGGHMVEAADYNLWRDGFGTTGLEQMNGVGQSSTL
jgi:hypothetical protein